MIQKAAGETRTLYEIRQNIGLKHADVAASVSKALGVDSPLHWTTVCQWEARGTNKSDILDALAVVYGLPIEAIKSAAKNSKQQGRPAETRRPRKNPVNIYA